MDYFEEKKSKVGKIYYQNKITGESQWGHNTFFNTGKQLPKGYIRLDFKGQKPVYKYIGNRYTHSDSKIFGGGGGVIRPSNLISMSYKDLLTKEDPEKNYKAEAFRRYTLFEKVADLLKLTSESICDESLQYLANQADVSVDDIISYIERKEREDLQENANLTAFQRIRQTDDSFLTERSIRELCGVNMRDSELSEAMNQLDQLSCHIVRTIIKDPVMCSSGHTYEREAIEQWFRIHRRCPDTNEPITDVLIPNHALRNVLDDFVKKYKNQRGEIWKPIRDECDSYQDFMRTVGRYNPRPVPRPVPTPVHTPVSRPVPRPVPVPTPEPPGPHYLSVETRRALALLPDTYIDPRLESWENMYTRYEDFGVDTYDTFGAHRGGSIFRNPSGSARYENLIRGEHVRFVILSVGYLRPGQRLFPLTREQEVQLQNVKNILERSSREIHGY